MKKNAVGDIELLNSIKEMFVPKSYLENFEIFEVRNLPNCWEVEIREKETEIPVVLIESQKEIVLDGYCNPVSVLSQCFSLKKVFLIIYRRRWKEKGGGKHYSNEYDLTADSAKITKEMAFFFED
jgi:predicted nucleotidyltransferase